MRTAASTKDALPFPRWFRLTGLVPLVFFLVRLVDYVKWDTPSHLWWSCHVANLTLAIGMLAGNSLLMRLASLWLILGLPPWVLDMWATRLVWPVSLLTHLGGALFALWVIAKVRMARGVWWWALLWFLALQGVSRFVTPPATNVNAAFHGYGASQYWFNGYWQYWLANTAGAALLLWLLEWGLARLFPVVNAANE
ncbi:MAG: hypothetical protein HYR56_05515 [Acidobacteria bacterium]|nr:hypothetical protein [Acidobacteriota bacterium]MBI3426175.1 hypothetical protein [Acidobacteriota bacterium]